MKYYCGFSCTLVLLCMLLSCSNQQEDKAINTPPKITTPIVNISKELEPLDKSPVDMAWFPNDYPLEKYKGNEKGNPIMRIIYSRPHLQGRTVGKDVAAPDTLWRMGANENNEIEFFKDVTIAGKKITKGKYILFCQPHQDNWQLYLSTDINSWGLKLDTTKIIAKTFVPVQKNSTIVESLTMQFSKNELGATLSIYWGDAMVKLPVEF